MENSAKQTNKQKRKGKVDNQIQFLPGWQDDLAMVGEDSTFTVDDFIKIVGTITMVVTGDYPEVVQMFPGNNL